MGALGGSYDQRVSGGAPAKLESASQGALAGGGDPASSPLYVFGPFLSLIVAAGVARVTFGASIWLAVVTIGVVSLLYRLVMRWVVDGSGGTGLAEEELGSWAAKTTASLTCVEYTLTFLVSIAALVTFVADRIGLNGSTLGLPHRTLLAAATSALCGWLVSRGPRTVSRVFGPATAGVLALLWVMIIAVVARRGLHVAPVHWDAFRGTNLRYTLGGYVRILALMTGIEVFANLVASYSGPPAQRSRKAFTSLMIIMGSTALAMLVVGPAILDLSDPSNAEVSVFTQTMDALLPHPLALIGTVVGIAVLLSAAAASALGIESLFLGLSVRHYAPVAFGVRNHRGIASRPVWLEVGVAVTLFAVLGTDEATYLAIYAAGVFVLLSMTGWAAVLRLTRRRRAGVQVGAGTYGAVLLAATFTSVATVVLFYERFADGVWLYALLVPALALSFNVVRRMCGDPGVSAERIGRLVSSRGSETLDFLAMDREPEPAELDELLDYLSSDSPNPRDLPLAVAYRRSRSAAGPLRICVPLDGSALAEAALPYVVALARVRTVELELVHVLEAGPEGAAHDYLALVDRRVAAYVMSVNRAVVVGRPSEAVLDHVATTGVSLVILSTHGYTGLRGAVIGSVATDLINRSSRSIVAIRSAGLIPAR